MPRLAYVAGRIVPLAEARVHIEDRGHQFADAVYEVCAVLNGRLFDWPQHAARLTRNLSALGIAAPLSPGALDAQIGRLTAANRASEALLYIQVSRGAGKRDHVIAPGLHPTLTMTVRPFDFAGRKALQAKGIAVASVGDQRWGRCDIKTVGLLANVLAKTAAKADGAAEAWLIDADEFVAEGGSTNAWLVKDGGLVTPPLSARLLPGVMRATVMRLARDAGLTVVECPFTLSEAHAADEAFVTSTTMPVVGLRALDGRTLGNGAPGPVTQRLGALVWAEIAAQTGFGSDRDPTPRNNARPGTSMA